MKITQLLIFSLLLFAVFASCEDQALVPSEKPTAEQSEDSLKESFKFTSSKELVDDLTSSSVTLLIASNNQSLLNEWLKSNEISLEVIEDNFDEELNRLLDSEDPEQDDRDFASSSEELEPGINIFVENINIDSKYNEYGLKIARGRVNQGEKSFEFDERYYLGQYKHFGRICWNFATPSSSSSNTVQYEWYRKWKGWFQSYTLTESGNLNSAGECDDFFYSGKYIRLDVRSNFLNYDVFRKKNSGDSWEEIF